MFAGHYAPAFAIRGASSKVPLWALFVAVQLVDIFFFVLVVAEVEGFAVVKDEPGALSVTLGPMPYTHSLLMTSVYAALAMGVGAALKKPWAGALFGLAVVSHWFADLLVHTPDLHWGLEPHGELGLGLWNYPLAAFALEIVLVVGSYLWLRRALKTPEGKRWAAICCAALVLLQLLQTFVIPPPKGLIEGAITVEGIYLVFIVLAYKVDTYESPAPPEG